MSIAPLEPGSVACNTDFMVPGCSPSLGTDYLYPDLLENEPRLPFTSADPATSPTVSNREASLPTVSRPGIRVGLMFIGTLGLILWVGR